MRRLLILLAAVALLAAGCGGGGGGGGATTVSAPPLSKQAYQAKLKAISKDIAKRVGKTGTSGELDQQDVDKLASAFHTFADRLREVNPPMQVRQLHARLIKALDDLGDEFPSLAKKLNSSKKNPSDAVSTLFGAKSIQELIKLGQDFKAKGFNLDLNG